MAKGDWVDKCIRLGLSWPTERQWITFYLVFLIGCMLQMAVNNPKLWDVELFKILLQALLLTGLVNMALAFHYAANKTDETKTENTGKALDAIKATAEAAGTGDPTKKPDVTIEPGETKTIQGKE